MTLTLMKKVYLGFGLLLALLVAVAVIAIRSERAFVASNKLVRHTYEVIDDLRGIETLVVTAENGRRAYILTGDERLLTTYETAVSQWPSKLQSLRLRTADNPRQQQRLDQLEPIIGQKLTLLRDSIALQRQGGDEKLQAANTLQGVLLTETIREIATAMVNEERALLPGRSARSAAHAIATEISLILGSTMGFITVLLAGMMVRRDLERQRVERERQAIFEIIQGVSTSADLEALLKLIHQTIQKVVYAENCFVALYDEHTETLDMQFFVDKFCRRWKREQSKRE